MPITITLPDKLADTLQIQAETKQLSLDELVTDLLSSLLEPDLESWPQHRVAVGAELKATSSLERVRGLLRPEGELPTGEDLVDDYTRYLIEKYT